MEIGVEQNTTTIFPIPIEMLSLFMNNMGKDDSQ